MNDWTQIDLGASQPYNPKWDACEVLIEGVRDGFDDNVGPEVIADACAAEIIAMIRSKKTRAGACQTLWRYQRILADMAFKDQQDAHDAVMRAYVEHESGLTK
mgnify:CR=1 FL=1